MIRRDNEIPACNRPFALICIHLVCLLCRDRWYRARHGFCTHVPPRAWVFLCHPSLASSAYPLACGRRLLVNINKHSGSEKKRGEQSSLEKNAHRWSCHEAEPRRSVSCPVGDPIGRAICGRRVENLLQVHGLRVPGAMMKYNSTILGEGTMG